MYAWPKFHGFSPYNLWENDQNTKKNYAVADDDNDAEKQYICLASASQARQKSSTSSKKRNPWFNDECKTAINKRKSALWKFN